MDQNNYSHLLFWGVGNGMGIEARGEQMNKHNKGEILQ